LTRSRTRHACRVKKKKLRKSKYSRMEDMEFPVQAVAENGEEEAHEDGDITGESEAPVEFSDFVVPTVAPPKDFAVFQPAGESSDNNNDDVFDPPTDLPTSVPGSSYIEVEAPVDSADEDADVDAEPNDSLA
jgi:hypothetical protein